VRGALFRSSGHSQRPLGGGARIPETHTSASLQSKRIPETHTSHPCSQSAFPEAHLAFLRHSVPCGAEPQRHTMEALQAGGAASYPAIGHAQAQASNLSRTTAPGSASARLATAPPTWHTQTRG